MSATPLPNKTVYQRQTAGRAQHRVDFVLSSKALKQLDDAHRAYIGLVGQLVSRAVFLRRAIHLVDQFTKSGATNAFQERQVLSQVLAGE